MNRSANHALVLRSNVQRTERCEPLRSVRSSQQSFSTHKAKQAEEQLLLGEAYDKGDLVFARPDGTTRYARGTSGRPSKISSNAPASRRSRCTISAIRMPRCLAKAGVPIEVISNRLGHSCISITVDRYLTVYQERDAAAAAAFERLVA